MSEFVLLYCDTVDARKKRKMKALVIPDGLILERLHQS